MQQISAEETEKRALQLLCAGSSRSEEFKLGNVSIEVNSKRPKNGDAIQIISGVTVFGVSETLPFTFYQYLLPMLKERQTFRALDISSSAGLAGLLLAKLGCQVDLFSWSSHTREILAVNVQSNAADCRLLDQLDPSRTYDLIIVDAFEIAQPAEIRAIQPWLADGGTIVLYGFPASHLETLREELGPLRSGWRNETCIAVFQSSKLIPRAGDELPEPGMSGRDSWSDFLQRFQRWKACFRAFDTAPNWRIGPTTDDSSLAREKRAIRLLPALLYGTGSNVITRLVLSVLPEACSRIDRFSDRVLDLGCGSGVLAIAAYQLGCRKVDAMDVDRDAVALTQLNAEINNSSIDVLHEIDLRRRYSLVIANLFGPLHEEYLPTYDHILRSKGLVVMGGFDAPQEDGIKNSYREAGYELVEEYEGFKWKVCLWQRTT